MSVEIKSETVDLDGKSAVLVSVKNGEDIIGTCHAGLIHRSENAANTTRLFYIGNEPIANILCPNYGNKNSDKLISLCPGLQAFDPHIYEVINECFDKLNNDNPLPAALRDIFCLLSDGVYAVYVSDYYPTDGSGSFFWGGYNVSHEVRGTAEINRTIGADKTYKPCFLIPTQPLEYYKPKEMIRVGEISKTRKIHGIAYHISGFHSALLKGHYDALSCIENDIPFKCAVIEKITEPYTEIITAKPAAPAAETPEEGAAEQKTEDIAAAVAREGITGFRCPSLKIPLEAIPKEMLRIILTTPAEYKPEHFNVLNAKLGTIRKKSVSNNILPITILEKSEQMPDCSMVESAYAIKSLSDEELNCLLAGDVEHNGEVIVSPNFYSSIVTACNFLQFTDIKRFVDFSIAIMDNPELIATHEYVAKRACSLDTNKKLYSFFKNAVDGGETKYEKILPTAKIFVERYRAASR